MHEHDNVAIITDDWGGEQKFYILVSPDHLRAIDHHCWRKDIPTNVNPGNATEEGFEQCHYVLPR